MVLMRLKKAKNISEQLKSTFNQIAEEFHRTRSYPGKEFTLFKDYIKPNSRILDLGCGNGRLLKFLNTLHIPFDYIGMDNSEKMLEIAQKEHPHNKFSSGDQTLIPLANNSIDLIFNIRAFHHVPSNQLRNQALQEMKRVLNPDGILILTVWNLWRPRYFKYIILTIFRSILSFGTYALNDVFIPWAKNHKRYYHAFIPGELSKIVSKNKYEIMELFSVKQDGSKVKFKASDDIVIIAKNDK